MAGESGPRIIREVKAFRTRDGLAFGLPYSAIWIVGAATAMLAMHYEVWLGAALLFGFCAGTGTVMARKDPFWLENLCRFIFIQRIYGPG